MKKIFLLLMGCLMAAQWSVAQPKWVEKAKQAVFQVMTYDKDNKLLNVGNGFFVSEDGVAVSDYSLFKGAQRAEAVNYEGKQMPVEAIMGADDMYDVIKFRVAIPGKKVPYLLPATTAPAAGADIAVLPYSVRKDRTYRAGKVKSIDPMAGNCHYYTLDLQLPDKMVSCPVVNKEGYVLGLAQKASGKDTASICYAVDVNYALARTITALSFNDRSLQDVGIKKALPDTEEQALIFLYMSSTQLPADRYMVVLNEFVSQYPQSADGYLRRAAQRMQMSQSEADMDQVTADLDKAVQVAVANKDNVIYTYARNIYAYCLRYADKPYKDWSFDKALQMLKQAMAIQHLPLYDQLEGDICFAKQDYAAALAAYQRVNQSAQATPATFFSAAKTKERMKAPAAEVLALLDSCVARFTEPYTQEAAPYLLERAQARMNANQARLAVVDYDAYHKAMSGNVNDLFYYYREQAAMKSRQYQRALDDIARAIEMNPKDLTYRAELAVINIRINRCEEAVKALDEALAIEPGYGEAYRLKGIALIQLKRRDEACTCFAKAKELGDPYVDSLIEKHCK